MTEPMNMKELEDALEKTSPYTAPGASGIPSEIWKSEEWKLSAISLLIKDKDNVTDPTKYRPVALLDTLYKVYTSILSARLQIDPHMNKLPIL